MSEEKNKELSSATESAVAMCNDLEVLITEFIKNSVIQIGSISERIARDPKAVSDEEINKVMKWYGNAVDALVNAAMTLGSVLTLEKDKLLKDTEGLNKEEIIALLSSYVQKKNGSSGGMIN